MTAQHLLHCSAQLSRADAVHDAHFMQVGEHGSVQKRLRLRDALARRHADEIDFPFDNGALDELARDLHFFSLPLLLGRGAV